MSNRSVSCSVDVLRNGVRFAGLTPRTAPSITMTADAVIKMVCSGDFTYDADAGINFLDDLVRPNLIIDGASYPMGVYQIGTMTTGRENGTDYCSLQMYDQCMRLEDTTFEARPYYAAGTSYMTIIETLLQAAGITRVISDTSAATLPTAREDWDPGTSYLTVINELLAEINFRPLWFDLSGVARLTAYVAPSSSLIAHTYRWGSASIISPDYGYTLDIFARPNVFVVTCENPDLDAALTAIAENDNPNSIISTIRRGRRIVEYTDVDNIASQAELTAYAANLVSKSQLSTQTLEITTALEPEHGVYDVIAVEIDGVSGVYEEWSWSMSLEAGAQMTHTGKRVLYL